MSRFSLALAATVLNASPAFCGQIILDQPHDFVGALASEQDTAVPFARTADDFFLDTFQFPTFRAEFIASFPNLPQSFVFEVYLDTGEGPGTLIIDFPVTEVIDQGSWNGQQDLHLLELTVDTEQFFAPGQYWFSAYAVGNGSGSDRGFWGTSGEGSLNGSEGYFMSEHFGVPVWTPVSDPRALGFASDFAFTIEGVVPAPGGLAILAGVALVKRRRRI